MKINLKLHEKQVIDNCKAQNMNSTVIGKVIGKNPSTIRKYLQRKRETDGLPPKIKQSKSSVTARMGLQIKRILLNNSKLSVKSARALLIANFFSDQTVPAEDAFYRYLKNCGWKNVKSVWQPPTSSIVRAKRLAFVERWLHNGQSTIGDVIWSDETTVKSHPNTRREKHWIPLNSPRPVQTKKHSGGISQMFWGCISRHGKGPLITIDGTMDQNQYLEVLKNQLIPEIEWARGNIVGDWKLMQDNCPAHRARRVTEYLRENNIEFIEWPPYSPDLNPIENLWNWMKHKLATEYPPCETNDELVAAFLKIWDSITPDMCKAYCDDYEKRLEAVKRARGYGTKY
jgi:hypothetical protein